MLAAARWYLDAAAGWGAAFVLFNAHVPGFWSGRAGHPAFCLKWGDRTRQRRHRNWHPIACRLVHACRPDRDRRRMARATVGRGDAGLPPPTRGIPIKRALGQRRWARGTDLVGIAVLRLTDPAQKSVHKDGLGDSAWSEACDRGGRLEVFWINGLRAEPRGFEMVPAAGIEPATSSLQNRRLPILNVVGSTSKTAEICGYPGFCSRFHSQSNQKRSQNRSQIISIFVRGHRSHGRGRIVTFGHAAPANAV